MDNIGSLIRKLRKANNDSLQDLGKKLGYSFGALGKIERGEVKPSIDLLRRIASIYDEHVSYFIGEKQQIPKEIEEKGVEWLSFINEMEKRDLSPDEIKEIITFIYRIKSK